VILLFTMFLDSWRPIAPLGEIKAAGRSMNHYCYELLQTTSLNFVCYRRSASTAAAAQEVDSRRRKNGNGNSCFCSCNRCCSISGNALQ